MYEKWPLTPPPKSANGTNRSNDRGKVTACVKLCAVNTGGPIYCVKSGEYSVSGLDIPDYKPVTSTFTFKAGKIVLGAWIPDYKRLPSFYLYWVQP